VKKVLILIIILALAAGGYYWYTNYYAVDSVAEEEKAIVGSGVIEAETIVVTSETGGRIVEVYGREGTEVETGDVLIKLDDSLLKAQRVELEAAINTAKANLDAAKATPQPSDIVVAEAAVAQANAQEKGADQIWRQMLRVSEEPQELLIPLQKVQAQIQQTRKMIEFAEVEQKSAIIREEDAARDQSAVGKTMHQVAQKQRQAADVGVQLAKANLRALRIQLRHLQGQHDNPIVLQTQANQAEDIYHVAETAVSVAEAQLALAKVGPRVEDIAVAEAQVQVAESARALLENQMNQLTLAAPAGGLITTRTAEPGKMAIPGVILFSLANLDQVTLRVFIPETQIGKVGLGDTARVTVDSVDHSFEGIVTFIANQAEFTPQNVQIAEERVNLVFAVEISLDNPDHVLKPGMPADAEILAGS